MQRTSHNLQGDGNEPRFRYESRQSRYRIEYQRPMLAPRANEGRN